MAELVRRRYDPLPLIDEPRRFFDVHADALSPDPRHRSQVAAGPREELAMLRRNVPRRAHRHGPQG